MATSLCDHAQMWASDSQVKDDGDRREENTAQQLSESVIEVLQAVDSLC